MINHLGLPTLILPNWNNLIPSLIISIESWGHLIHYLLSMGNDYTLYFIPRYFVSFDVIWPMCGGRLFVYRWITYT